MVVVLDWVYALFLAVLAEEGTCITFCEVVVLFQTKLLQ